MQLHLHLHMHLQLEYWVKLEWTKKIRKTIVDT